MVFLVLNHSNESYLIADEQVGSGRRGVCLRRRYLYVSAAGETARTATRRVA
ncbi:hypothetical protein D3C72_2532950 [compost metagenome]